MLRGINVSGQKLLRMEALREIYVGLGLANPRTYVQSGNVIFESDEKDLAALRKRIEAGIQIACGYSVPVFIRQGRELLHILEHNPFLTRRNIDLTRLYVTFLYNSPPESAWGKAIVPAGIADEFSRGEQDVHLFCPNGYGKTKLSNGFFERKLGVPVTTRNWNTVNALYRMVQE